MKMLKALTLFGLLAALITPPAAHAGNKEKAIIGGVLGGLIIGAVIADDDVDARVSIGYRNDRRHYRHGHHRNHGYWKWITVKTWVPGYYERSCDRYGRPRKVWISGYYDYHKRKVWVDSPRSRHGHYYRHHDYRHYDRRDGGHQRYEDRRRSSRDYRRHEDGHRRQEPYERRGQTVHHF